MASRALLLGVVLAGALTAGCEVEPFRPELETGAPQVPTGELRLARVIEPGDLGTTSPAGLAYSPRADALLVVAPPLESFTGAATDLRVMSLGEPRSEAVRVPTGVSDPVNTTFDGGTNRFLMLQPESGRLIVMRARTDGTPDGANVQSVDVGDFGLRDPQGLTIDPASGRLFVLDAAGPRIVRLEPDARGGFARDGNSEIDLTDAGLRAARGLAFDPSRRRLQVLDPASRTLYELTEAGEVVRARDLSEFALSDPQGMTFAPSSDNTDEPSELNLFIADGGPAGMGAGKRGDGRVVELALAVPTTALPAVELGSLIQTVETWRFSPSSPDPAGITYLGQFDQMLISDSEVNEMSIFTGVNLFRMTRTGGLEATTTTTGFSDEPTGITWNPTNRHVFISDDTGTRTVYEVDPGDDGLYGTPDDIVTSFRTGVFGSNDPEGVTYDSDHEVLFVVDGVNREIYRVAPGPNGVFDGTDDVVTHFDTQGFGLDDPEGIAYDSDYGHLYAVGKPAGVVFHLTTTGTLLRTIDISAASPRKPAGLAYAPSSINPGAMSLWVVARGVDNDSNPNENDGMAYEFALPSFSGNGLPSVTITGPPAGSTFTEGTNVTFSATASDIEDGDLTAAVVWSANPGGSLGTGGSVQTSTLSAGAHTITATVMDAGGQQASDHTTITIVPEGVVSVDVRVAQSADDGEEGASGGVSLTSSDLELVVDGGSDQTVGMRFVGVDIPAGAIILNASIQFQTDEVSTAATSLSIQGEATDNAAAFSGSGGNISSRNRTTASVPWAPAPWSTLGEAGLDQRTPNIAPVIQEIVSRSGWASGNALAVIVTGTGKRTAESYDGVAAAAPLLHVDYQLDPDFNFVPTASDVTITGAAVVGEELTGHYTFGDLDGDAEGASQLSWLRDGQPIGGATTDTYTLVAEDEGALIVFEVTPVAATGASPGVTVQSAAHGPVLGTSTGGSFSIDMRVSASTDDAEEKATGGMRLASSDLELVYDGGDQTVGMRFNGVAIPRGATITNATIQFQVDEVQTEATSLLIQGEAADHAATFAGTAGNISTRGRTAASVPWVPVPWTTKSEAGPDQQTPDLRTIIQEIVNRPLWASGNSLAIIITGTGRRTAEAYDGVPGAAPLLHVEYSLGSG